MSCGKLEQASLFGSQLAVDIMEPFLGHFPFISVTLYVPESEVS